MSIKIKLPFCFAITHNSVAHEKATFVFGIVHEYNNKCFQIGLSKSEIINACIKTVIETLVGHTSQVMYNVDLNSLSSFSIIF